MSCEAVLDVLETISNTASVDAKGKAAATGLSCKLLRVDFVVCLMFMRIILWKTKVLTESLQAKDFNIVHAIQVLKGTITSLEDIRKDSARIANQAQVSIEILSSKVVNAHREFSRLHRPRKRPHRLDENADTAAKFSMVAFYEKEFRAVLDTLIQAYKENMKACLKKVKALSIVLQPQ